MVVLMFVDGAGTHLHGLLVALPLAPHHVKLTEESVGATLYFIHCLKKLKLVVWLILQADEAFHYPPTNTLQQMESLESRSH